jgi:hypothetical protein
MANEARVNWGVTLRKSDDDGLVYLDYRAHGSFSVTVSGAKGPTPGAFSVTTAGVDVDLSQLTTPALVVFKNLSPDNYVTYGIYDPESTDFYPFGELLPGESYVLRLSRDLGMEYGAGTGTGGPETNRLHFRANTATVYVSVEAFEA